MAETPSKADQFAAMKVQGKKLLDFAGVVLAVNPQREQDHLQTPQSSISLKLLLCSL
jgi:hypothetical protein